MNKIYTSYYGNRKVDKDKFYKVQISTSKPSYYEVDKVLKQAAPDWSVVDDIKKGRITESEYTIKYLDKLNSNKDFIIGRLSYLLSVAKCQGKDLVLLCYEKPGDFCHRHILMEWLESEISKNKYLKHINLKGELE